MVLSVANLARRFRADEHGATSVVMGVLMIPLVGALRISGFELVYESAGLQNAEDSVAQVDALHFNNSFWSVLKTCDVLCNGQMPCPGQ